MLSFIGIAIGAVALLMAIVHFWAGPFAPQQSLEQTVAEKAVAIKKATIAALNGEKAEKIRVAPKIDIDQAVDIATAVLGGSAIIFGVIGFATKESLRAAGGAALLGGAAIAFQFAVVALGAVVLAILVAAVISQIGID